MTFRLRSYDRMPPGGYIVNIGGKDRAFPIIDTSSGAAIALLNFRMRNRLPRASYAECLVDADREQCVRLGNNPEYCISCGDGPAAESAVAISPTAPGMAPCKGCGAPIA